MANFQKDCYMNNNKKNRSPSSIKLISMLLPCLPILLLKSTKALLHFKRQAKKGGHVFQQELLQQGIDQNTAKELTSLYLQGSHLLQYFMNKK